MKREFDIKKAYWESQFETVCTGIAELELRLKLLERMKDNEVVGEKTLGRVGSTMAKKTVEAKEARELFEKDLQKKQNMKNALDSLINPSSFNE